jgi:uncharacterized protein (TIGR02271 family)
VIGLLSDLDEAQRPAKDLKKLGLRGNQISVIAPSARAGASVDGLQLASMDVAGLGPVAAGGPLLQYLTPATAEANPDALIASLRRMGVPEAEATGYVHGVRNGYTLEAAIVDDDKAGEALAIMRRHAGEGDTTGLREDVGSAGGRTNDAVHARTRTTGHEDTTRLPVVEEELTVGKRAVSNGGVRVSTHVIEQPLAEQVTLREEHIDVQRNRVDRSVESGDDAFRERTIEVTATAEQPVVAKRAHVVEEVVVKKDVTNRTETVRDTVRKTDVRVEKLRPFDEATYRDHFQQSQARLGERASFDQYAPAYRFGHELRGDRRFAGADWDRVEPEARTSWEKKSPGTWERFKDSVRHAWQRATE